MDVILIVGALKPGALGGGPHRDWCPGPGAKTPAEALERAIKLVCESGKDAGVVRSAGDLPWVLANLKAESSALGAAWKYGRVVHVLGGREPRFAGWMNAISSRGTDPVGDLRKVQPGQVVPRE